MESVSSDTLILLLRKIAQTHGGQPLPDEELLVTVQIAEMLHSGKSAYGEELSSKDGIFLPSQDKKMFRVEDLYYDVFDGAGLDLVETDGHQCYLGIPPLHAQYLGVRNQREANVARHSLGLPFGQFEDLTTRLQNLLKGYPYGSGIFRDLHLFRFLQMVSIHAMSSC